VVLWAWCPTVVLECGNNGHVDVLAALLVVAALGASARGRPIRAGLALGAAVATKLLPILLLPALLAPVPRPGRGTLTRLGAGAVASMRVPVRAATLNRNGGSADGMPGEGGGAAREIGAGGIAAAVAGEGRRWLARALRLTGAALTLVVVVYLPHVLAVGPAVVGFLPGYLSEEGYGGQRRFPLLQLVMPETLALVVAAGVLAGVAWAVARRTDPGRPWEGAVVLVGVAFAVAGITYPWYALLLVALVALDGRWEWLAIAAAGYPGYFTSALHIPFSATQETSYAVALVTLLAVQLVRRRAGRAS
jgi:hypothetical protein